MRFWATLGILEGQTTPSRWEGVATGKAVGGAILPPAGAVGKAALWKVRRDGQALTGKSSPAIVDYRYLIPTAIAGIRRDRGLE